MSTTETVKIRLTLASLREAYPSWNFPKL